MSNDSSPQGHREDPEQGGSADGRIPVALRVAAGVMVAEGVAGVVLGVLEVFTTTSSRLSMGVTTAVFLLLYGVGLAVVGAGLARAAPWSRGPAVFTQLIQLGVAWSFRGGSTTWVAVLLALAAFVVLGAMFRKESTAALLAGR
ncbi:MAG TPA: hypothetical protein VFB74_01060 [Kribbellaceae bacterium]|nr:hypothetical protein [Kribbellaceae bacterium]